MTLQVAMLLRVEFYKADEGAPAAGIGSAVERDRAGRRGGRFHTRGPTQGA